MQIVIKSGTAMYRFTRAASAALMACGLAGILMYAWTRADEKLYQLAQRSYFPELTPAALGAAGVRSAVVHPAAPTTAVPSDAVPFRTRALHSPLFRRWTEPDPNVIGRLVIPKLAIDVIIREGADDTTLRRAVGHLPASALPGGKGNVILTGHRDTFFRPLRNIRNQDEIIAITANAVHTYRVYEISVVAADDTEVLRTTAQPECTLVTCFPFDYVGSAPRRFIVRARLVTTGAPPLS